MYSKSAIGHATASLAHELLPLGVRVNGIAPGLFVTEMSSPGTINDLGQSHLPEGRTFGFEVPVSRPVAQGQLRAGTNRDMGALVLFLVANWFVDGETVLIDGGVSVGSKSLSKRMVADRGACGATDLAQAFVIVLNFLSQSLNTNDDGWGPLYDYVPHPRERCISIKQSAVLEFIVKA